MAADWIKMRVDLRDDPDVVTISEELGINQDEVVGKLHRIWSWADTHTKEGKASGITEKWLDKYVEKRGFSRSMVGVGWLEIGDIGINFPHFERHNGDSAKRRSADALRKKLSRERPRNVPELSAECPDKIVTREEKRRVREENNSARAPQFVSEDERKAAYSAMDRWSAVGRGHPLRATNDEHRKVAAALESVAQDSPIIRNGEQVGRHLLFPLAVQSLMESEFRRISYACKCVVNRLEEWARKGVPGSNGQKPKTARGELSEADWEIINADTPEKFFELAKRNGAQK